MTPHDELNLFLKSLSAVLRLDDVVRSAIVDELRDHLAQRVDELMQDGLAGEEAIHQALDELGGADALAASYARTFRKHDPSLRRKRIMKATLSMIATAAVVVLAGLLLPFTQSSAPAGGQPGATGVARPLVQVASLGVLPAGVGGAFSSLPFMVQFGAAGVPEQINHQGVVTVNSTRYSGAGQFRFALINGSNTPVWMNAPDLSPTDGVPDNAVSLTVNDGIYSVRLGDTTLANMTALTTALFNDDTLRLRVWFDDGTHGIQALTPDQALTSSPYAFMAAGVSDDSITTAKIADGAVTSDKVAANVGVWARAGNDINYAAPSGKVGIGLASPGMALDVNGQIRSAFQTIMPANAGYEWWTGHFTDTSYWQLTHRKISDSTWTNALTMTPSLNFGVGTQNPGSYRLYVNGTAYSTGGWAGSDARLKDHIQPVERALNRVLTLRGVQFDWRREQFADKGFPEGKQIGLIAQDVEKAFPELVNEGPDGFKAVAYDRLAAVLVEAIKEQQKEHDAQQRQIEQLKRDIDELRGHREAVQMSQ